MSNRSLRDVGIVLGTVVTTMFLMPVIDGLSTLICSTISDNVNRRQMAFELDVKAANKEEDCCGTAHAISFAIPSDDDEEDDD